MILFEYSLSRSAVWVRHLNEEVKYPLWVGLLNGKANCWRFEYSNDYWIQIDRQWNETGNTELNSEWRKRATNQTRTSCACSSRRQSGKRFRRAWWSSNLNDTLAKLENQILTVETQYLQEDCPVWNIVRGFENFNERWAIGFTLMHRLQSIPRRTVITRDDRIFSLSSHASPAMNLPMDDDNRSVG